MSTLRYALKYAYSSILLITPKSLEVDIKREGNTTEEKTKREKCPKKHYRKTVFLHFFTGVVVPLGLPSFKNSIIKIILFVIVLFISR